MGVRVYPTNESMAQALATGECWMCIMWLARARQWQDAGAPIEVAYPKEGTMVYGNGWGIPKNARNVDAAYAYIKATLEPKAQIAFADHMRSEERRVGKECVSTCRSSGSPYH